MQATRRLVIVSVAALVLAAIFPHSVSSQCAFNSPSKAKVFKTPFVRAFVRCPGISLPIVYPTNSVTGAGAPACSPPVALSGWLFAERGSGCQAKVKHKAGDVGSDMMIKAKCSGILEPGGTTNDESAGWKLAMPIKMTIDDPAGGDMVVVNFPVEFAFAQAAKGRFKGEFSLAAVLDTMVPGQTLPACATIGLARGNRIGVVPPLSRFSILDPTGATFAEDGTASSP